MIEANEITPRLFMGSVPPTGTEVAQSGFSLLVLCALPSEYRHVYSSKLKLQTNPQDIRSLFPGVRVIVVSLDDNFITKPSKEEQLRAIQAASEVSKAVRAGQKVLVTCMQGRNRSGLVAALALRDLCGWSGSQAKARVRLKRKLDFGVALMNPIFVHILDRIPAPIEPANRGQDLAENPVKPKIGGISLLGESKPVRKLVGLPSLQRRW